MKILLLTFALILASCFVCSSQEQDAPYLIVLSMDGFRWDYPDRVPTPNLARIARQGVKAKGIIPSFPTVTFPNHYSLATGLYPDHHGIVHNSFYDPALNLTYKLGDRKTVEDGRFYGGEPIWITAEKQGIKTASFYWVGSEAPVQGMRPAYWKAYDKSITYGQRIDTVISWLNLPVSQRPHLVMFYFDQPDKTGHKKGPYSLETRNVIMQLDSLVGIFLDKAQQLPIHDKLNIIITSDHGMSYITDEKKVVLERYISLNWCERINGYNPIYTIDAKTGYTDSILLKLQAAPHLRVWKKNEVPQRLHFGSNDRIGALVVLADSSYSVVATNKTIEDAGAHGYDNRNTDMHAIFYAQGPVFQVGYVQPPFENVNLYPLMAFILKLKPASTDGSIEPLKQMLKFQKQ
jgi:predicted AlkP superfamily pyrophosphatase or phosphodiesterase